MTSRPGNLLAMVDTCVFSFMFGNRPEAEPYKPHLRGMIPTLSLITVGELYKGAYRKDWPTQSIAALDQRLRSYLIIPPDRTIARQWGRVQAAIRGRNFPENDAWIAATALALGCPLLSHNRKDFEDIPGLHLICYS